MRRKDAGMTLIEVVTVLTISALLLTIGIPGFRDALQRTRVATTVNLLSADIAMARSSAVMGGSRVSLCPRADGQLRCSEDGDWRGGWMVFADPDGNQQPDADSDRLRVTDPPGGGHIAMAASRARLAFTRDGRAAGANLSINVCDDDHLAAQVIVNNLGRVRSARPDTAAPCPSD